MSNESKSKQRIAIIAGTGFEEAFDAGTVATVVETPYGDAAIFMAAINTREILLVPRHGVQHNVPPHKINVQAQIWALHAMNVSFILSTAATGSLRYDRHTGDIIILSDFIDWRGKVTTFYNGDDGHVHHTDFSEPFSAPGRDALIQAAADLAVLDDNAPVVYNSGTYLCVNGPRYETPAEVKMFAQLGADVVGMTVAQEAILSRELEMGYAAAAVVTNLGTGMSDEVLLHADVSNQMAKSRSFLIQLFSHASTTLFRKIDS